jgi:hypothetical protein
MLNQFFFPNSGKKHSPDFLANDIVGYGIRIPNHELVGYVFATSEPETFIRF